MLSVLMKLPFRSLTAMEDADLNQTIGEGGGGSGSGAALQVTADAALAPLTEVLAALTALLYSIKSVTTEA